MRAVREALGPEGRIRVDANGGWNVDEAEHAIHALAPVRPRVRRAAVRERSTELAEIGLRIKYMGIPIAADESVRRAEDPLAVAEAGAADLLVIKAQPLGGIRRALRIIEQAGLPVVVSSALDTSVGLAMGAQLAASVPDARLRLRARHRLAAGGGCHARPARCRSTARSRCAACSPTPSCSTGTRSTPERTDWWIERLGRVHAVLERPPAACVRR